MVVLQTHDRRMVDCAGVSHASVGLNREPREQMRHLANSREGIRHPGRQRLIHKVSVETLEATPEKPQNCVGQHGSVDHEELALDLNQYGRAKLS